MTGSHVGGGRRESRAVRGIVKILGGSLAAQAISLAGLVVLARLVTPAEMGVLSVATALALTFATVAALRMEFAVPLPHSDDEAKRLVLIGLCSVVIFAAVMTGVSFHAAAWVERTLQAPGLGTILPIVVGCTCLVATFQLMLQWALRERSYGRVATRNVIQAVVMVLSQIGLSLRGWGSSGLVIGMTAGYFAAVLTLGCSKTLWVDFWRSRGGLRSSARRYARFAYLMAPAGLVNAAGIYAAVILIGMQYGLVAAGYFGLAQRILAFPMVLMGQAIAQVYLAELAHKARSGGSPRAQFIYASQRLGIAALIVCAVVFALSEVAFPLVLGETWTDSGSVAKAMSLAIAAQLVAAPLSQTLIVYERLVTQFVWDICRFIAVVVAIWLPATGGASLVATVWTYSATSASTYFVSWGLSYRVVRLVAKAGDEPVATPRVSDEHTCE